MSDQTLALLIAAWAAWSLANLSSRVGRIPTAIEVLRDIVESNRR